MNKKKLLLTVTILILFVSFIPTINASETYNWNVDLFNGLENGVEYTGDNIILSDNIYEDFDSYSTTFDKYSESKSAPNGWMLEYSWNDSYLDAGVDDGEYRFHHGYTDCDSGNYAQIYQQIDLEGYSTLRFKYRVNSKGGGAEIRIDGETIWQDFNDRDYTIAYIDISSYKTTHKVSFRFSGNGGNNDQDVRYDDIMLLNMKGEWVSIFSNVGSNSKKSIKKVDVSSKIGTGKGLVENFEDGSLNTEWVKTTNFDIFNSPSRDSYSAGQDTEGNNIDAEYSPDSLNKAHPEVIEFYWYELSDQTGFTVEFEDDSGNDVLQVGGNNPQWELNDGDGSRSPYDGGGDYQDWILYHLEFDWTNGEYSYKFKNTSTGATKTGTHALINNTNISSIKINNSNTNWGSADHMWFDDFLIDGKSINFAPNYRENLKISVGVDKDDDGVIDEWSNEITMNDGEDNVDGSNLEISQGYGYKVKAILERVVIERLHTPKLSSVELTAEEVVTEDTSPDDDDTDDSDLEINDPNDLEVKDPNSFDVDLKPSDYGANDLISSLFGNAYGIIVFFTFLIGIPVAIWLSKQ